MSIDIKRVVTAQSVAIVILAATCTWLYVRCDTRRFVQSGNSKTLYVMFDHKTAQACWSGPPSRYSIDADGKNVQETNEMNLPFCKNLK